MDLISRLDAVRDRWNVLEHPFYRRWECGELSRDDLAYYAGQYRHAVVALADAAATTVQLAGPEHAAEEAEHVALWDDFASALGAPAASSPRAETQVCVRAWTAARDELEGLAVLYAIEAGQPAVSRTKLAGLVGHYGLTEHSPGTAYFTLHASRDSEHAEHSRRLLEEHATPADEERLVGVAEKALRGNWTLLDGVQR